MSQTLLASTFEEKKQLFEKGIETILQIGNYPDRETVLFEAFELFLLAHPGERLNVAIQLYLDEVVSLSRAAELAGLNFFDFEAILKARAIPFLTPDESADEIKIGVSLILGK